MTNSMHPGQERLPTSLLDRYLSGEATSAESARVDAWIAAHPGASVVLDVLRQDGHAERVAVLGGSTEQRWATVASRMRERRTVQSRVGRAPARADSTRRGAVLPHLLWTTRPWTLAAVIGVVLTVIAGISIWGRPNHTRPVALTTPGTVYTTRPGQRATIDLRDGTRVSLNVASTLEIPRDFGAANRTVRLVGQAAFEVAHAAQSPFIVDAAGTRTTVLGTAFAVRAYDTHVRVSVRSGKVAVSPCGVETEQGGCRGRRQTLVLTANDVVSVMPSGDTHVRRDSVLVGSDFAFASGRLVLRGAPLGTVVGDLDRWYDVDIRLADSSLGNLALGGWFPAGSVVDLVHGLEGALGVRVIRHGRVVTVYDPSLDSLRR